MATLNPTDRKIVACLEANEKITIPVLQIETGLSRNGVKKALNRLKQVNVIRRVGPDKGGHWEIVKSQPAMGGNGS